MSPVVEGFPAEQDAQDVQPHEGPKQDAEVGAEGHKNDAGLEMGQGVRQEAHKPIDCTAGSKRYSAGLAPQAAQVPWSSVRKE